MFNKCFYELAKRSSDIVGFPVQPLWIYAQWRHETDNFTSDLCVNYYNLAGLTQKSVNDTPQPDGSLYYMQFSSYHEFAEYFGRYLCLFAEDGILDAYTLDDYAAALKHGGYFGDSLENYIGGMKFYET
jgi:hypothetical protein